MFMEILTLTVSEGCELCSTACEIFPLHSNAPERGLGLFRGRSKKLTRGEARFGCSVSLAGVSGSVWRDERSIGRAQWSLSLNDERNPMSATLLEVHR